MVTHPSDFTNKAVFHLIGSTANALGANAFIVGDYVRDCFLGRENRHINIVVEGDALEIGKSIGDRVHTKVSCFKNFGVATFHYKGDEILISRARNTRVKRGGLNKTVGFGTLFEDLLLRDFTIESLAISLNKEDFGRLIDPSGGLRDLVQGVIRTIDQPETVFQEDPLGMLRAIRLSVQLTTPSLDFRIATNCMDAIQESAYGVASLSRERVVEELNKMLLSDTPGDAIYLLDKADILRRILPALAATKGVKTVDGDGHEDTFPHTLTVLDNIARLETRRSSDTVNSLGIKQGEPNLWLRWTALLHDIGKPAAKRHEQGKGWTFYGYDVIGARMIPKVFSSLKMPLNDKLKYVQKLISLQNRPKMLLGPDSTESAFRRLLFDAGDDINDLMLLCEANITTRNKTKANQEFADMEFVWQRLIDVKEKDAIKNLKIPINANYIMDLYGLEPCNLLGVLKDHIKDAILQGEIGNNFEEADALLRKKAAEMGLLTKEERLEKELQQTSDGAVSNENNPSVGAIKSPEIVVEEKIEESVLDEAKNEEEAISPHIEPGTSIEEPLIETQEDPSIETQKSKGPVQGVEVSEIIQALHDCGITKLYFMASGEDLEGIHANGAIRKETIFLYTQDISAVIRGKFVWALEIKLDALSLPEAMVFCEGIPSKEVSFGTEIANLHLVRQPKEDSGYQPTGTESMSLPSNLVFVIRNCLPMDYLINFEPLYDEYSTPLIF